MKISNSITLQEELVTDSIELTDGHVVKKVSVEEGISVCQDEKFIYKKLYQKERLVKDNLSDIVGNIINDYVSQKDIYILYENKQLKRKIFGEDNCEHIIKSNYSEIVVCCTDKQLICPVFSYGITNNMLSPNEICFRTDLYIKYLQEKKNIIRLKNGKYNVVMFPEVMGVLIHEIIGHLCEADNYLDEQMPDYPIGYNFGMPITVYDDPCIPNAWGSISCDDEGNKAQRVVLVEKGYITNLLTSNSTAEQVNIPNNGHARCSKYDKKPIVRMTNTIMQFGTEDSDCMVQEMQDGIIARMTKGGYMYKDFFGITIIDGLYIHNGQVSTITNCLIRGRISDVINHITQISTKTETMSGRGCIKKGQGLLPVSVTSPYVTFESLYIEQK